MSDSAKLKPYKKGDPPSLPGSEQRYQAEELQRIELSLSSAMNVIKRLEERIVALGG